jgi:hypothetical protein
VKRTNTYGEVLDLAVIAPTVQAYDLEYTPVNTFDETMDETFGGGDGLVTFSRGNGSKYVAIVSQSPITKLPSDGVTYSLGHVFSDGSYVIAKGSIASIDTSDLAAGTWYIRIFEFNGFAGVEKYNRTIANDNPLSFTV